MPTELAMEASNNDRILPQKIGGTPSEKNKLPYLQEVGCDEKIGLGVRVRAMCSFAGVGVRVSADSPHLHGHLPFHLGRASRDKQGLWLHIIIRPRRTSCMDRCIGGQPHVSCHRVGVGCMAVVVMRVVDGAEERACVADQSPEVRGLRVRDESEWMGHSTIRTWWWISTKSDGGMGVIIDGGYCLTSCPLMRGGVPLHL